MPEIEDGFAEPTLCSECVDRVTVGKPPRCDDCRETVLMFCILHELQRSKKRSSILWGFLTVIFTFFLLWSVFIAVAACFR